jgi:hypothetical protein
MTNFLWYICLPVQIMSTYLYNMMSCYPYDVCLWCLLKCMMYTPLYELCLLVWCCSTGRRLPRLIYRYLLIWFLPTCMMSAVRMMSVYLYDVSLPVWCLHYSVLSAQLYDVCLLVWCLPACKLSAQLDEVCSTIRWLPTCMTSALLYDICLPT